MTQTFEQNYKDFQGRMMILHARTEKLSANIVKEARATAKLAGLSPEMPFLHAHNALCSFEYGQPWAGVNYSLTRRVIWLEQKSWEPSRLYDRIWRRAYNRMLEASGSKFPRYEVR